MADPVLFAANPDPERASEITETGPARWALMALAFGFLGIFLALPLVLVFMEAFKRGIEPIAAGQKLGALLAQFPASFHDTPASRAHLAALLRAFSQYRVAVEPVDRAGSAPEQGRQFLPRLRFCVLL